MKPYHLVKVTDKKWADRFQEGELFMKALECFSDLSKRDISSQNTFRGDILEGFAEGFKNNHNPHTWIETPEGRKEIVNTQSGLIDILLLREKVFCMYALEYNNETSQYVLPDSRMKDFGDTAIIITDTEQFLHRYCNAIIDKYDYDFWTSFRRVSYDINLGYEKYYDEFHKSPTYKWQNEFRIALDLAKGKFNANTLENVTDFAKLTFPGQIEKDTNPDSIADTLTLEIGDLHDISISIPTKDFVSDNINSIEMVLPKIVKELNIPKPNYPTFFKLVSTYT